MTTNGAKGLLMEEPLIFERSSEGRVGIGPAEFDVPEVDPKALIPEGLLRGAIAGFPDVSEMDAVRHYTRLSQWNFGVDTGFYPLGSCTMKYNPKVNEATSRLPGFTMLHPYEPEELTQGALELMHDLEGYGHGEIAQILGVAEGTSKARLFRAREKLRTSLGDVMREYAR